MMTAPPQPALKPRVVHQPRAFSMVELIVVIAVISLLIGIAIPLLAKARVSTNAATCLSNLRQLATAFDVYTQQNRDTFPDDMTEYRWDDLILPHLSAEDVFICPDDPKRDKSKLSYDWRHSFAVADPRCSLANKQKGKLRRTNLVLVFESLAGWHDPGKIQAATIDGAATAWLRADFEANLEEAAE